MENPVAIAPSARSAIDPRKFFIFDPQSVLTDGVIFISGYLFDERFILRMLSP